MKSCVTRALTWFNSTTYSEQEFKRDFQEDPNSEDEYEDDPRAVADYDFIEGEERTVEETADAICAMDVFGGGKRKTLIWKIKLNEEDPKTIDIDLRQVRKS